MNEEDALDEQWEWGRFLGRGSYGSVFLAFQKTDKKRIPRAVKVFDMKEDFQVPAQCTSLLREVKVMKSIPGHPNVVECFGSMFDQRGKLCIVMEFMGGGTLGALLRSRAQLNERIAAMCVRQVVEGVTHLHKQKIFHRDLKGDNILVHHIPDGDLLGPLLTAPQLKLADFGNSKMKAEEISQSLVATTAKTVAGTALWMAPEVIRAAQLTKGYSPAKADVWSVGIVACEILQQGRAPWPEFDNAVQALFTIGQWNGGKSGNSLPPESPSNINKECRDFLNQCMVVKAERRPAAEALLRHKWIASVAPPTPHDLTHDDLGDATTHETTCLRPVSDPKVLQKLCLQAGVIEAARKKKSDREDGHNSALESLWTNTSMTPPPEDDLYSTDADEGETIGTNDEEDEEDFDFEEDEEGEEFEYEEDVSEEAAHLQTGASIDRGSGVLGSEEHEFATSLEVCEPLDRNHLSVRSSTELPTTPHCKAPTHLVQRSGSLIQSPSQSGLQHASPVVSGPNNSFPNAQWVQPCSPTSGSSTGRSPTAQSSPTTPFVDNGHSKVVPLKPLTPSSSGRGHRRSLPPMPSSQQLEVTPVSFGRGRPERQRQSSVTMTPTRLSGMPGLPVDNNDGVGSVLSPVPAESKGIVSNVNVKDLRLRFSGGSPSANKDRTNTFASKLGSPDKVETATTPSYSNIKPRVGSPSSSGSPIGGAARSLVPPSPQNDKGKRIQSLLSIYESPFKPPVPNHRPETGKV